MISISFEDLRYANLQTAMALHEEILKRVGEIPGKAYLFFDEIQEVEGWEKCINSFRVSPDCDIYITGSNAKLLSGELATYLGGRYVEFMIYPFSFSEFLELYHSVEPDSSEQQAFQKYLLMGGMPYLANLGYREEPCRLYLTDLFNSVQLKDIVQRNNIRDVDLLQRIISYVIANVGTTPGNQRKILHGRSWRLGDCIWRQYAGHQSDPGEHGLHGGSAPGLRCDCGPSRDKGNRLRLPEAGAETLHPGHLPAGF